MAMQGEMGDARIVAEQKSGGSDHVRTDSDREFAAISEGAIWEEAKDRLRIAAESENDNRKRAKASLEFREGKQWDTDVTNTASEDSPQLTINLTDALVKRVENNIRQQRPRGKCHPVGDGADIELAEIINGIGRHVETRSEASVAYDTAASSALTAGWGYFRLVSEYVDAKSFQKDLRILPIRNIFQVHMDPAAIMPSAADQNWCIISMKMKRQEYKRRFPNMKNVHWEDMTRDESRLDWEDKEEVRLAEYFRIFEKEEKVYQIRGQNGEEIVKYRSELPKNPQTGKAMSMKDLEQMLAERGMKIEGDRDSTKRQVQWFRLNGLQVVERAELPGQYIPVFRVEGNCADIDGRIIRRGMVSSMQDPARMVNYGEVAKIKRLGLAPKAPWVAAEGQLDGHPEWDDANMRSYSVLTYKPVMIDTGGGAVLLPPPVRQAPAQIEAGFADFVQGMRTNLMAVSGMPNEPGMDKGGEVVSGQALKRRQFMSDQAHFQYYDNLTQAIAQCWRCMVEWIPNYFSEERMQRIIGEDSVPKMVKINHKQQDNETGEHKIKNDLSVGRYDIVMDTGPGYETKREEGAQNLIDLMRVGALAEIIAKTGPDLVFRSIDHPYMQELADRLRASNDDNMEEMMEGLSTHAKSIVQSLMNKNKTLEEQLKNVQDDLKHGITKAHMAGLIKMHDVERSNETKRIDTETRAHAALSVAEIKAGASLMNTHVEAAHHKAAAEQMIKRSEAAENNGLPPIPHLSDPDSAPNNPGQQNG